MRTLSVDEARRYALAAQGFTQARPNGRIDVRHFRRVMATVGLLQLDTVNVLVRAHYLPMFSRIGPYDRSALDRWTTESGELFEYWGHMASLLPTAMYPTFRWRMEEMARSPWGSVRRILKERPEYIAEVFQQVRERGPLTTNDLDDPGERGGPWWGYQPGKHALEWLFAIGKITAYRTPSFGRLYDLPERVLPEAVLGTPTPSLLEAYRALLLDAGRHLGVGTAADLADYHRLHVPTARQVIKALVEEDLLEPVSVEGWKQRAYRHDAAVLPRESQGTALISPFDSLIFNRDRVERVFGFHYRIEIYVPRPERRYGYYVLPFLLDGRLVARVDLKADRDAGALLVQASHLEAEQDPDGVTPALAGELEALAGWLGLSSVVVRRNGDLARRLAAAVG